METTSSTASKVKFFHDSLLNLRRYVLKNNLLPKKSAVNTVIIAAASCFTICFFKAILIATTAFVVGTVSIFTFSFLALQAIENFESRYMKNQKFNQKARNQIILTGCVLNILIASTSIKVAFVFASIPLSLPLAINFSILSFTIFLIISICSDKAQALLFYDPESYHLQI